MGACMQGIVMKVDAAAFFKFLFVGFVFVNTGLQLNNSRGCYSGVIGSLLLQDESWHESALARVSLARIKYEEGKNWENYSRMGKQEVGINPSGIRVWCAKFIKLSLQDQIKQARQ